MQLKIQRSQRMGGVLAGTVVFSLDVRADYSEEERHNINRYRLGGQVIYNSQAARKHLERADAHLGRTQNRGDLKDQFGGLARGAMSMAMAKMSLNISIASLGRGHHIECKDLDELLEAEEAVREACKGVTRYLEVASTFDGSEMVIEYDKGEERVHITQNAPPLIEYHPQSEPETGRDVTPPAPPSEAFRELGRNTAKLWAQIKKAWRKLQAKVIAFADEKGWDIPALRAELVQNLQARWAAFEQGAVALAAERGLEVSAVQVRAACGALAVLTIAVLAFLTAFTLA